MIKLTKKIDKRLLNSRIKPCNVSNMLISVNHARMKGPLSPRALLVDQKPISFPYPNLHFYAIYVQTLHIIENDSDAVGLRRSQT